MIKKIYFDMDGTIANLYAVEGWLPMLRAYDPTPYAQAVPMVNMSRLARYLHKAQRMGIEIGIISWLSKEPTEEYDRAVTLGVVAEPLAECGMGRNPHCCPRHSQNLFRHLRGLCPL